MTHDRIAIDPDVMYGKPCVQGTRVTVEHLLRNLGEGLSVDEILRDHPHLSETDVYAAAEFAADYMAQEDIVLAGGARL